jgi:hypothetical protein
VERVDATTLCVTLESPSFIQIHDGDINILSGFSMETGTCVVGSRFLVCMEGGPCSISSVFCQTTRDLIEAKLAAAVFSPSEVILQATGCTMKIKDELVADRVVACARNGKLLIARATLCTLNLFTDSPSKVAILEGTVGSVCGSLGGGEVILPKLLNHLLSTGHAAIKIADYFPARSSPDVPNPFSVPDSATTFVITKGEGSLKRVRRG